MLGYLCVVLSIGVLIAGSPAAAGQEPDDPLLPEMLELSWREFDQNPAGGWRPLADRGEHARAAALIEGYLRQKKGLEEGQRAYLHFHAGMLLGYEDRIAPAVAHFDSATVESFPPRFPKVWNELVRGTRAFLLGDSLEVRAAAAAMREMPGLGPRDSMFVESIEVYADEVGRQSLREIMDAWMEE